MTERIYNFSAGPAVLPLPVLEQVQRDLISLPGVGMSILEISHRSKKFDEIIQGAEEDMRKLAGIPANYHILFLQGGASLQFSMVPMNLLPAGGKADYILTGSWSKKAMKEAQKIGSVNVPASTESDNFSRIPKQSELKLDPEATYVHYTTNNTIFGTEWSYIPDVGSTPLVADASSDIFSGPIDIEKYALIYAGAQKNLAPAGLTLVIIRDDMLARSPKGMHTMLDYNTHASNKSLYNTPPVFAIYVMRLVMTWLLENGGLEAMKRLNDEKARILYESIDSSDFYRGHAASDSRSSMNVTFRLPSEDLEKQFVSEATRAGLDGLKGHRSVGGCRASIYNAFPKSGVESLSAFMKEFERTNRQ
ncbi:MAG TPA: 3-phosphoserine/phosphohydroxythreonine transaminase [Blastocatellia bacterium]|nr:3-phosphoserine/phosphohydroxythreonine transaminase [Blastocatellia bacterium]